MRGPRGPQDEEWIRNRFANRVPAKTTALKGRPSPIKGKKIKHREKLLCPVCNRIKKNNLRTCSVKCSKISTRKVKERPSKEQLLDELKSTSYVQVGKKYGVSDNTIRKWTK